MSHLGVSPSANFAGRTKKTADTSGNLKRTPLDRLVQLALEKQWSIDVKAHIYMAVGDERQCY
jgi:hypothetical protein